MIRFLKRMFGKKEKPKQEMFFSTTPAQARKMIKDFQAELATAHGKVPQVEPVKLAKKPGKKITKQATKKTPRKTKSAARRKASTPRPSWNDADSFTPAMLTAAMLDSDGPSSPSQDTEPEFSGNDGEFSGGGASSDYGGSSDSGSDSGGSYDSGGSSDFGGGDSGGGGSSD